MPRKSALNSMLPLRYVRYGRMSSDKQNPRSPTQQFDEIDRVKQRSGYPWVHVGDYRDDGISGRVIKRRPGLQKMLRDIKSGKLQVDAILVDTYERFGRADELAEERRILYVRFGVLILTADSGFSDPNSVQGRALGAVESIRATEDTRIKSHNVQRGKQDAVLLHHWPGGEAPFGFRLESIMGSEGGRQVVLYSILKPDPITAPIVAYMYKLAFEKKWGSTRIAAALNADPQYSVHKVFQPSTVAYILSSHLYHGDLVYGKLSVSIIDDRRIVERNSAEEIRYETDFCPPIVSREVSLAVKQLRRQRGAANAARLAKNRGANDKQIEVLAPGIALRYPVTGLIRCGLCGRALTPAAGGTFETQAGEVHRYVRYKCPVHRSGVCPNDVTVPEEWIREAVAKLIRQRVLGQDRGWLQQVTEQVRRYLRERIDTAPDVRPALEQEINDLQDQMSGWSQTLGNSKLSAALRSKVEADYDAALQRNQAIEQQLAALDHLERTHQVDVDDAAVIARLERLETLLGGENATATNVELAFHIDWIKVYPDGRVVIRTCMLGALTECTEALQDTENTLHPAPVNAPSGVPDVRARRRPRLQLVDPDRSHYELEWAVHTATDPDRFAGVPEDLFWHDELEIPIRKSWAEEIAIDVARCRLRGLTHEEVANEFDTTIPTIRDALRHAKRLDPEIAAALAKLPPKMPRGRWHEDRAEEVLMRCEALMNELGVTRTPMKQLVSEFQKSEPTILKALKHARQRRSA